MNLSLTESIACDYRGEDHPVPRGHAWGTKVAEDDGLAPDESATVEEMWERLTWFLERIVPVAEEAGVRLAAHPDDPPIPVLRGVVRSQAVSAVASD